MNIFIKIFLSLIIIGTLCSCQNSKPTATIGIVVPLEHTAMKEIITGYTETLKKLYDKPVTIDVENAQNDVNMQRAIIQKMRDASYSLIVPIGVDATEMTLSIAKHQNVVSLASDISDADRHELDECNVAVVHDDISVKQLLSFIHATYPQLTQLTLVHSAANKVLPEVDKTVEAGKDLGITIHHLMISSLPELYSAATSIPADAQGIFILKDHMIVSGISTLAKIAADKHIPLITSDQGSVQNGAAFAVGVHEREIGVQGAKLSAAILKGRAACELPIVEMNNLTVFINQKALQDEKQALGPLLKNAKQFAYKIEMTAPLTSGA